MVELQRHGIITTTINPGFVVSEMTASNKFYMPFRANGRGSTPHRPRYRTKAARLHLSLAHGNSSPPLTLHPWGDPGTGGSSPWRMRKRWEHAALTIIGTIRDWSPGLIGLDSIHVQS